MTTDRRPWALVALAGTMLLADPAVAVGATAADVCEVPESAAFVGARLPFAAKRLKAERALRIVVVGTASAAGAGVSHGNKAFPARLETELARLVAPATVGVVTKARRGDTAADMANRFDVDVIPEKPALVVWQTGTNDATRGTEVDDFGETLKQGIDKLHALRIDVLLVDPQYNPRFATIVNLEPYREAMGLVAQSSEVLLFRRYDAMQYWVENGVIDLSLRGREEQTKAADLVHDCIGRILARMIESAVQSDKGDGAKP